MIGPPAARGPAATSLGSGRDLVRVVCKHFRVGAATTLAAGAVLAAAIHLWPVTYRSEAKLLVRLGQASVALDPAAALGSKLNVTPSRESEIKSELQIIRSADLLRDVVQAIGPEQILPAGDAAGDANAVELAVARLDRNLRVSVEPESNVVSLGLSARTAELAQRALRTLIESYLSRHNTIHMSSGAADFFQRQIELAETAVTDNRRALRAYEEEHGLYDLDGQRQALLAQIASREGSIADVAAQIALASGRVRAMHARLEGSGDTDVPELGTPSTSATQALRSKLVELRLQESELTSRYAADSRSVQQLREQIELAERLLVQEQTAVSHEGASAIRERIRADLDGDKITLAGLELQLEALERQREECLDRLRELDAHRERVLRWNAEIDLAHANRIKYRDGLEQARIDAALDAEKISNVRIVQQPSLAFEPGGPPRLWLYGIALLIALFAGAGVIGFAELLDDTVCTPDDVLQRLDIASVASLPNDRRLRAPFAKRPWSGRLPDPLAVQATTAAEVIAAALGGAAGGGTVTVGITSGRPGAGVTTAALHLAMAWARRGTPVLLIDANEHDPSLAKNLTEEKLASWEIPGLLLWKRPLAAGPAAAADLARRLPRWRERAAIVLVDLPALSVSPVTIQLARQLDRMLLVVDAGKTRWRAARQSAQLLAETGARPAAVIVNRRRYPVPEWLYRRL